MKVFNRLIINKTKIQTSIFRNHIRIKMVQKKTVKTKSTTEISIGPLLRSKKIVKPKNQKKIEIVPKTVEKSTKKTIMPKKAQ